MQKLDTRYIPLRRDMAAAAQTLDPFEFLARIIIASTKQAKRTRVRFFILVSSLPFFSADGGRIVAKPCRKVQTVLGELIHIHGHPTLVLLIDFKRQLLVVPVAEADAVV